jgi:hypothetical protein
LALLDQHDHSAGFGVPITPNGMNISSDLSFRSNNLTTARSIRFTPSTISAVTPDLGCIYVNGVDLYYNDLSGNQIPLTTSGHIAGSVGSISGLTSPATASYSASTFIFRSAANTAAYLDSSSITIRNLTAGSNGITIAAPNALASNFTINLPSALPSTQSVATIDSSGNIATPVAFPIPTAGIATGAVAQANLAARATGSTVGAGGFGTATTLTSIIQSGATTATIATITITTTGRPVIIMLVSSPGGAFASCLGFTISAAGGSVQGLFNVARGSTGVGGSSYYCQCASSTYQTQIPLPGVLAIDPVAAGTYTYTLTMQTLTATNASVTLNYPTFVVYES